MALTSAAFTSAAITLAAKENDLSPTRDLSSAPSSRLEPSSWVVRHLPAIDAASHPRPWLIDWACGHGRHSRLALGRGWNVFAVDRDDQAIAGLTRWQSPQHPGTDQKNLHAMCIDLETDSTKEQLKKAMAAKAIGGIGAIVVCHYLFRKAWTSMVGLLDPGGYLICETFAQGQERLGRPSRGAFLLQAGELLAKAQQSQLAILAYEDLLQSDESGKPIARLQRLYARKHLQASAADMWLG